MPKNSVGSEEWKGLNIRFPIQREAEKKKNLTFFPYGDTSTIRFLRVGMGGGDVKKLDDITIKKYIK